MNPFNAVGHSKKTFSFYSLKNRLILSLTLNSLIPIILIGCISYFYIHSINVNKVQNGVQNEANSLMVRISDALKNLNDVSLQVMYSNNLIENIQAMYSTTRIFDKYKISQDMDENIRLINFMNPGIDYMFYYLSDPEKVIISESNSINADFDSEKLPLLFRLNSVAYYGPHKSMFKSKNIQVMSVIRTLNIPGSKPAFIYIEADYNKNSNDSNNFGMNMLHFVCNEEDKVLYSEDSANFPVNSNYKAASQWKNTYVKDRDFYVFQSINKNGWKLYSAIKKVEYNREIDKWFSWLVLIGLVFLVLSIFLAGTIWRTVYTPIKIFGKEIQKITEDNYDSKTQSVRIKEFDELFVKFGKMTERIKWLLNEVKQEEKMRSQLQVEKLLYQINPHFLHNTLDNLRWMARVNGQDEIDSLASALIKVLHYNLGKLGETTTVAQEVEILKDYIAIQKMRYDFIFTVRVTMEEGIEDVTIPRFILQPLVENSMHHGLRDEMIIDVDIRREDSMHISISVKDNGRGMDKNTMNLLLLQRKKDGKGDKKPGIGFNYVMNMVKVTYGEEADINIESSPGEGTLITLRIPIAIPA